MVLQKYLDEQRQAFGFKWLTVVNNEGLTVCNSGIDEQFELAALLPEWTKSSHQIAHSVKLNNGMGLICLVPQSGGFLLLIRDFEVNGVQMYLLVATPKIPAKAARVMVLLCNKCKELLS